MGNGAKVQTLVAGFYWRKGVKPVPSGVKPGLMSVGHTLGQSRGASGVPNNKVVGGGNWHIGVFGRLGSQPIFIALVSDKDAGQVWQLVLKTFHFMGVVGTDQKQSTIGMPEHVGVRRSAVSWI